MPPDSLRRLAEPERVGKLRRLAYGMQEVRGSSPLSSTNSAMFTKPDKGRIKAYRLPPSLPMNNSGYRSVAYLGNFTSLPNLRATLIGTANGDDLLNG